MCVLTQGLCFLYSTRPCPHFTNQAITTALVSPSWLRAQLSLPERFCYSFGALKTDKFYGDFVQYKPINFSSWVCLVRKFFLDLGTVVLSLLFGN